MPKCEVTSDGYCHRHGRYHRGYELELALSDSEYAESVRRAWDVSASVGRKGAAEVQSVSENTIPHPFEMKSEKKSRGPCVHLGPPTGEVAVEVTCTTGARTNPVHECRVFGKCTVHSRCKLNGQVLAFCARGFCPGYSSSQPDMLEDKVRAYEELISGSSCATPAHGEWFREKEAIEAHKRSLLKYVSNLKYTATHANSVLNSGNGDGIVIVAGGSKYFACAWILLSVLKRVGCRLPVEIWHLGEYEMDQKMKELLQSFGADVIDATKVYPSPRMLGGWSCKPLAILASKFRRVLYLDADQVPMSNPEYLFGSHALNTCGSILWPDFLPYGWCMTSQAFEACGLEVPRGSRVYRGKPTGYRPVESGQVLVDKYKTAEALLTCLWLCEREDFWFPSWIHHDRWLAYGDKDCFYCAWNVTKTAYEMPPDCNYIGIPGNGCFVQKDMNGRPVFQHKVQPTNKWSLHGHNEPIHGMKYWELCLESLHQLRAKWVGHPYDAGDESEDERNEARALYGARMLFVKDGSSKVVSFNPDRTIDGLPGMRWSVRHMNGNVAVIISDWNKALAICYKDNLRNYIDRNKNASLSPSVPSGWSVPMHRGSDVFENEVYADVVIRNEYKLPIMSENDVVFDVGAHMGAFVEAAFKMGAGKVVAFEPNPEIHPSLMKNTEQYRKDGRCIVVLAAAWSEAGKKLKLRSHDRHSAAGTVVLDGVDIGEVDTVDLSEWLNRYEKVSMLKLDCEGCEYELIDKCDLSNVDRICGEWHRHGNYGPEWIWNRLVEMRYDVRIEVLSRNHGHFWATRKGWWF